jgi:hypothetical protein
MGYDKGWIKITSSVRVSAIRSAVGADQKSMNFPTKALCAFSDNSKHSIGPEF